MKLQHELSVSRGHTGYTRNRSSAVVAVAAQNPLMKDGFDDVGVLFDELHHELVGKAGHDE